MVSDQLLRKQTHHSTLASRRHRCVASLRTGDQCDLPQQAGCQRAGVPAEIGETCMHGIATKKADVNHPVGRCVCIPLLLRNCQKIGKTNVKNCSRSCQKPAQTGRQMYRIATKELPEGKHTSPEWGGHTKRLERNCLEKKS